MSDYIAPVDYDGKEVNAFTTKEDIEGLEEVVSAALTDLDSRLPQKYWGQQLPEGGTEITGAMSGVTSIRIPVDSNGYERFVIESAGDNRSIVIRPEANNMQFEHSVKIDDGGMVRAYDVVTNKLTHYASLVTYNNGSGIIMPDAPTFFEFPITGQYEFELGQGRTSDTSYEAPVNHYYWVFDTGDTAPTITWPSEITAWYGGSVPTIQANKHYEVSVLGRSGGSTFVAVIMEV